MNINKLNRTHYHCMKKLSLLSTLSFMLALANAQNNPLDNYLTHVGDTVVVSGKVYNAAFLQNVITQPTFLNVGDGSPRHRLIIRIEPEDRKKFPTPPEQYFLLKSITVSGKLEDYKGEPLIKVTDPSMLQAGEKFTLSTNKPTGEYVRPAPTATIVTEHVKDTTVTLTIARNFVPVKPDTIAQKEWIVAAKDTAAENAKEDMRILERDFTLRTAPYDDASVVAVLHEGMRISILSTTGKWSYVHIGSIDGSSHVYGFIKHRKFRGLKKE